MNRTVLLGGAVLLLFAIVSTQARPEGGSDPQPSLADGVDSGSPPSSTVAPDESKVSKFFDDVSTAFKQGTAKVKEGIESAATSVKDGVMRGYDYVKDKFGGSGDALTTPGSPLANSSTTGSDALTYTPSVERQVSSVKSLGSNSAAPTVTAPVKAVRIEPNDEEPTDDDRLIFISDEDTATDLAINTTPKPSSAATEKKGLDDRFILDGPQVCPKGQAAVDGKCRNTF